MTKQTGRRRPFGVTAIVVLQLIGVLSLIVDLFQEQELTSILLTFGLNRTLFLPVSGGLIIIYQLFVAFGLWRLKRWAWFLIMIQLGIGMTTGLWFYFNSIPLYPYMLFNVITVFYLNQREVQGAFERRTRPQEAAV